MPDYYFDIETYSPNNKPDFANDTIISIAYQQVDSRNGEIKSPLTILKSWETSERDILERFHKVFNINDRWAFIPIGFNLPCFDLLMMLSRWNHHGITVKTTQLFDHPYIDLHPVGFLCNGGTFSNCSLNKLIGKKNSGNIIAQLYMDKKYAEITAYIEDEATCFLDFYKYLIIQMPNVWRAYTEERGITI